MKLFVFADEHFFSKLYIDDIKHIHLSENIHILLWLLKDTCWLMEWKTLGITMIIPTLAVAIAISIKTISIDGFWVNIAICFWIIANSFWMCCEFFNQEELKYYAGIQFVFGFISVGWFYGKRLLQKNSSQPDDYHS